MKLSKLQQIKKSAHLRQYRLSIHETHDDKIPTEFRILLWF